MSRCGPWGVFWCSVGLVLAIWQIFLICIWMSLGMPSGVLVTFLSGPYIVQTWAMVVLSLTFTSSCPALACRFLKKGQFVCSMIASQKSPIWAKGWSQLRGLCGRRSTITVPSVPDSLCPFPLQYGFAISPSKRWSPCIWTGLVSCLGRQNPVPNFDFKGPCKLPLSLLNPAMACEHA